MDAFFAAIEERDKPRLKGAPIVVGADPKDGRGRGVVSTANYKAREYGIHSAQPISEAWRLSEAAHGRGLPRAVFIGGNYRRYVEVSEAIMEYLRTEADAIEPASIDEAYIGMKFPISNFSANGACLPARQGSSFGGQFPKNLWEEAEIKAKKIKAHIKKEFGLTCSIGIGPNKLISKIAAGAQKPDGLTIVHAHQAQSFLHPQSVRIFPGVGPKMEEQLHRLHIYTVEDLSKFREDELTQRFGTWGTSLYKKARGIDESPIVEAYETKSTGEQETFEEDSLDAPFLVARLLSLSFAVGEGLRRKNLRGKTISLTVRFANFETMTRARTLSEPVADGKRIAEVALQLFMPFLDARENPQRRRIRLVGVRVEKLTGKK
jgi:DNA polymerase IV (DinB-like DNA polymerase)